MERAFCRSVFSVLVDGSIGRCSGPGARCAPARTPARRPGGSRPPRCPRCPPSSRSRPPTRPGPSRPCARVPSLLRWKLRALAAVLLGSLGEVARPYGAGPWARCGGRCRAAGPRRAPTSAGLLPGSARPRPGTRSAGCSPPPRATSRPSARRRSLALAVPCARSTHSWVAQPQKKRDMRAQFTAREHYYVENTSTCSPHTFSRVELSKLCSREVSNMTWALARLLVAAPVPRCSAVALRRNLSDQLVSSAQGSTPEGAPVEVGANGKKRKRRRKKEKMKGGGGGVGPAAGVAGAAAPRERGLGRRGGVVLGVAPRPARRGGRAGPRLRAGGGRGAGLGLRRRLRGHRRPALRARRAQCFFESEVTSFCECAGRSRRSRRRR